MDQEQGDDSQNFQEQGEGGFEDDQQQENEDFQENQDFDDQQQQDDGEGFQQQEDDEGEDFQDQQQDEEEKQAEMQQQQEQDFQDDENQDQQQEVDYDDQNQMQYQQQQQNEYDNEMYNDNQFMSQQQQQQQNANNQQQDESFDDKKQTQRRWQWANPLIEGVPPCPRGGHSATLSGASVIVFGGHYYAGKEKGYVYLNDTYILDINANRWNKPKISGTPPEPRYNHSALLAGSRIIIFGGKGTKNTVFRDLHALDPASMCWYQGPEGSGAPSARFGHSASLVNGTKMLIFGGWNGKQFFNDLYILDLEVMSWSRPTVTGPSPSARQGHTAIQIGSNLIVQGGFCFDEEKQIQAKFKQGSQLRMCYLNDIRILDTDHFIWSRLRVSGTPPIPRYGHTSNISGPDILFFGGWTYNSGDRGEQFNIPTQGNVDYFVILNTETMSWEKGQFIGKPPLNRYGHTATAIGPHLLIFGGWEYSRATQETVVLRDLNVGGNDQNKLIQNNNNNNNNNNNSKIKK